MKSSTAGWCSLSYYFCIVILIAFTVRWNAELGNIFQVILCNDDLKIHS